MNVTPRISRTPLCRLVCALALVLPGLGLLAEGARAAETAEPPMPPRTYAVETIPDVTYFKGAPADAEQHRLDLFLPRGAKDYPVVVIVHGGAWIFGDKSFYGIYSAVGKFFAAHGIGAVLPNYRLAPQVQYTAQAEDLARAFAWTHDHIAGYGGDPHKIFLLGHSAGGHLISLLATDPKYLKAEGVSPADVKGVISVGGVYWIPDRDIDLLVENGPSEEGKPPKLGLVPDLVLAVTKSALHKDMPYSFFGLIFGDDPKARAEASPLNHVRPGLPPFLLLYADHDIPTLPEMAREFAQALKEKKDDVQVLEIKDRNHNTALFSAHSDDDPAAQAMLAFLRKYSR